MCPVGGDLLNLNLSQVKDTLHRDTPSAIRGGRVLLVSAPWVGFRVSSVSPPSLTRGAPP